MPKGSGTSSSSKAGFLSGANKGESHTSNSSFFTIPSLQFCSVHFHRSFDLSELYFCFILLCSREINLFCLLSPSRRLFI